MSPTAAPTAAAKAALKDDPRAEKVDAIEVVRHGAQLIVPETLTYADAVIVLQRKAEYEDEFVVMSEHIDAAPYDGALALKKAIENLFGFTFAQPTPGFWSFDPPEEISVDVSPYGTVRVPWGRFSMPGTTTRGNYIETGHTIRDNRIQFRIVCHVQRMYEKLVDQLAAEVRRIVKAESIYRGKAFRIKFVDDDGDAIEMPEPRFMDVSRAWITNVIFNRDLERSIDTNILTPLRHSQLCREQRIPLKRGVMLTGPYGTGKTMLADAIAREATLNGWTFMYIQDVRELATAIRFARQYEPCLIFAEDADRTMSGERTVALDEVLNTIDGIDSKRSEIMVVLTTNHLEKINRSMLRPGRLDVILNIVPPDAEAVQRLIRNYGGFNLSADVDLAEVGQELANQIPAIIAETVQRSKLEVIRRTGNPHELITADDLMAAAYTVMQQQRLFEKPEEGGERKIEVLGRSLGDAIGKRVVEGIEKAERLRIESGELIG